MIEMTDEALGKQVASLAPGAAPADFQKRVLQRVRTRQRVRRGFGIGAVALCTLVGMLLGTSYFAPRFATALASIPFVNSVTGPVLGATGLANVSGQVTALSDSSESAGISVQLIGGYADAIRTVLFLHVKAPGDVVLQGDTLTDQFGTTYTELGSYGNTASGASALEFSPLSGPAAAVGARLTLHISHVSSDGGPDVSGSWQLSGTILATETTNLPAPEAGFLGPASLRFTEALHSPNAVELRFTVSGLSAAQASDPASHLTTIVTDDHGAVVPILSERSVSGSSGIGWVVDWVPDGSAVYQVQIALDSQRLTRSLKIQS
jgi:Domain of unknown function (DUF4179)